MVRFDLLEAAKMAYVPPTNINASGLRRERMHNSKTPKAKLGSSKRFVAQLAKVFRVFRNR